MKQHSEWLRVVVVFVVAGALLWPSARRQVQATEVANPTLVLETVQGTIEIELLRGEAPETVEYVVNLVEKNFYRGLRFHRIETGLVQIGDPNSRNVTRQASWGTTGARPTIGIAEFSPAMRHVRGAVGLAHAGDPKGASSQFYIMKQGSPSLNGKHTIFGQVRKGFVALDKLRVADVLKLATIKEAGQTS
ncbi:MAG: peptidylprolyl isomerase [Acidobacteria bacterium]|jgi:peptidyl-prolyl cis-trans isomerase B (cyclophilin B)|nr:peptidylprolyl isomerase [Acidobacteriota bacterium]